MLKIITLILTFLPTNSTFYGVTLNQSAEYQGRRLYLTGYGMGAKKIGPTMTKVAVAQFFTENPEMFARTEEGALKSLDYVGRAIMSVTFLRGVDSAQVRDSITKAIGENITGEESKTYAREIQELSDTIRADGPIYSGETISIIADPYSDVLFYVNAKQAVTVIDVRRGFFKKVFSVWFGPSRDQAAYNLKMNLLQKPELNR